MNPFVLIQKLIQTKLFPIVWIFLIGIVFAAPYIIKGFVPFPSTYQVNFFPPWSYYHEFWGPIKNNAMPDIIDQIYPWKQFATESLKNGQIPYWNPYSFSGNPHVANFQTAVFSPFNLLFFLLPFIDAWSIVILFQPLLAGYGMYLFARSLRLDSVSSLISAVSFMFCGFMVVWMAYGTLSMAIAWLPFMLYFLQKLFTKPSFVYFFLLSLSVATSFFSGHFQTSLYAFSLVFFYFLFQSFLKKNIKFSAICLASLLVGIFISLIQIIPAIELYLQSPRSGFSIRGGGIPLYYLVTLFAPDFFGNPVTRNDWFGYYAEWSSFVGIIPLSLAIVALLKKNTTAYFFLFISIVSLLLAVDSPVQMLLGRIGIPVVSTSNPSRVIVIFSFSLSILAGFGYASLSPYVFLRKSFIRLVSVLATIMILFGVVWLIVLFGNILPLKWEIVAKRNFVLPTLLLFGFLCMTIISLRTKKSMVFALFILLGVSFDSFRFAQKWMPFDPKRLAFPDVPIIKAIEKEIGFGRLFGNVGNQIGSYYGIPLIEGYDPLYIERYGEFIRAAKGDLLPAERSVVKLDRRGIYTDRVLDLLGVTLFFHPIADTDQLWAYPVWEKKDKYDLVYRDELFQLFKNRQAMERATLFYDYEAISGSEQILRRFYSKDFDFRQRLILEEKIPVNLSKGKGSITVVSYTPQKIILKTISDVPALLFLSDPYYPNWKVSINGKREKIYRANYAFRAVVVPQGESMVEFWYKSLFFWGKASGKPSENN